MLLVFILPTNSISEPKPAKYANANNATAMIFLKTELAKALSKIFFVMLT